MDWNLANTEISRRLGVKRHVVAHMRQAVGRPRPEPVPQLRALVAQHPDLAPALLARQAGVSIHRVMRARRATGVSGNLGYYKHPWDLFNWELPSVDLAEVWKVDRVYVSRVRRERQFPPARWRRYQGRMSTEPAYLAALNAEHCKAAEFKARIAVAAPE